MHAGKGSRFLSFELNAQQIQHIASRQDFVQVMRDFESKFGPTLADKRWRPADDDVSAQFAKSPNIRSRGATMRDVADQGDGESVDVPAMLLDRQHVQQTLRRMIVGAIAGIDHTAIKFAGQQVWRPGCAVPRDNPVDAHRFDGLRGVDKRFALGDAAAGAAEFDGIGTQSFGGERETVARPRAVFVKDVCASFSAKQRYLAPAPVGQFLHLTGNVQYRPNLFGRKRFQIQQVSTSPAGREFQLIGDRVRHHRVGWRRVIESKLQTRYAIETISARSQVLDLRQCSISLLNGNRLISETAMFRS